MMEIQWEYIFAYLQEVPVHPYSNFYFIVHKDSYWLEKEFHLTWISICLFFFFARRIVYNYIRKICENSKKETKSRVGRWQDVVWQLMYFSFSSALNIYMAVTMEYFKEPWKCFEWPFPRQEPDNIVFWIYTISLGWYANELYYHFKADNNEKRSDYWLMTIHHTVTIILLGLSYSFGYFRIGVLVVFHTDLCDVVLQIVKLLRLTDGVYIHFHPMTKNLVFSTVPISWFVFRIVMLFDRVLWTTLYVPIHYAGWINVDFYIPFNIMLLIIYFLQVFWFFLIIKIALIKILKGVEYDDIRENHDE